MVRKNGEWIASTGKDIYRQSLKRLVDNYLRVNNSMLEEGDTVDIEIDINNIDKTIDDNQNDFDDINEYLNEYSIQENENSNSNVKMDEYVLNLNRITRMMEDKNVIKVSRHMNILLK
jgi:hypothetical protein